MFTFPLTLHRTYWTPAEITTAAWYDAADASTITEAGGAVSQWGDKSGNGRDATQGTGSAQPTTSSRTINGLNVLDFDGGDRLVNTSGASATLPVNTDIYVFAVSVQDTSVQNIAAYWKDGDAGLQVGVAYNGFGSTVLEMHIGHAVAGTRDIACFDGVGHFNTGSTAVALGAASITMGRFDRASGVRLDNEVWVDGTQEVAATSTGPADDRVASAFVIGGHGSTSHSLTRLLDGAVGEVIVAHSISASDRQKMEGYLAWKWGTVSNLPVSHPYKSYAP